MASNFVAPATGSGELLDPLQGYDIKVSVQSESGGPAKILGAFTSLMFKIVNQTETYLTLNNRVPRHLDGEIIIVWSMEQGLIDLNVVANTFGPDLAAGLGSIRGGGIPRQTRFQITFATNVADGTAAPEDDVAFRQNPAVLTDNNVFVLQYCRVDTMTFGVAAGRHIVANTWQGTAQSVKPLSTTPTGG